MLLTENIQEYRKIYYRKHRDYLLDYSKWYYSLNKYYAGKCNIEDIIEKPIKPKKKEEKIKKNKIPFTINKGTFILTFQ